MDDFQIDGIRPDVTESLMSAMRYSIALVEDAELVGFEGLGVSAATYSFSNLVCCKCYS